jgi:hypothetical protein
VATDRDGVVELRPVGPSLVRLTGLEPGRVRLMVTTK